MRRIIRPQILVGAVVLLSVIAVLSFARAAAAELASSDTPSVVRAGSEDIELDANNQGTVTLVNLRDSRVDLKAYVGARELTPSPSFLLSHESKEVDLLLEPTEASTGGTGVVIAYEMAGENVGNDVVKLVKKHEVDWNWLAYAFLGGTVVSFGLMLGTYMRVKPEIPKTDEEPANTAGEPANTAGNPADTAVEPAKTESVLNRELKGLGTDWSFKENWVNSVTLGAGVLAAFFGVSGLLKSFGAPGSAEEAGIYAAVSGVIASGFSSIGPLFTKMIGKDPKTPNVKGTLVAGFVALIGAFGQIAALTFLGVWLVDSWTSWATWMIVVAAVVVAWVTGTFSAITMSRTLLTGLKKKPKEELSECARELLSAIYNVELAIRRLPHVTLKPPAPPQGKAKAGAEKVGLVVPAAEGVGALATEEESLEAKAAYEAIAELIGALESASPPPRGNSLL